MKFNTILFATSALLVGCTQTEPPKPNLIFMLTDDQRWDALHCAGNDMIYTPEMDRLAADGIRFTNAFVTTPICAASRASILTGQYERTHGFTFTKPPLTAEQLANTYPYLLRKAGYHTGFIGKLGVKFEKGWIDSLFDEHHVTAYPYWKEVDGEKIHLTDLHGRMAMEFLDSCRQDQPFCLSISFWAPHAVDEDPQQYFWPEWCDTLYEAVTIPYPETGTPEIFGQHPDFIKNSFNRVRWQWRYDTPEKFQHMVKGYYRMISGVDRVIGQIRQKLEDLDFDDNTVIVLMGDNGYFLGERQFAGKWIMYEQSLRVPLIVFDPRNPAEARGLVTDISGLNIDIAPTLLSLAGVPLPASFQGINLMPVVKGEQVQNRDMILFEHLWDFVNIPQSECVRSNEFKLINYPQHPGYEEFYDLHADPDEIDNLINDPRQKERIDSYSRVMDSLKQEYGRSDQ